MKTGDVMHLGRHRLMCGDAGNPEHVAALFDRARPPDLVFTSPPYAQQRRYVSGIGDWDTLMQRVFGAMPYHEKTQVLVNLGLVHRNGEWVPYWDGWIEWMRAQGWRRFGWYVWDKMQGLPGRFGGRPAPSFEFIFHLNRHQGAARINKSAACRTPNRTRVNGDWHQGRNYVGKANITGVFKIPDSVFRVHTQCRESIPNRHPAVFPIALPTEIIRAYTDPGEVVYEPFAGSGTAILAAEREGRTCYAMECEGAYCDIAMDRFRKVCAQPSLPGAAA